MLTWLNEHFGGPTVLIFIGAIISAVGAVWAQIESSKQANKILELNELITNTVTGGDSYPIVGPVFVARHGEQGDIHFLLLDHTGKHPLYDVVVTVVDVEKYAEVHSRGGPINQNDYMWKFNIGTIYKGYEEKLMPVPNPAASIMRFYITVTARNGRFLQKCLYKKVGGRWHTATRITKNDQIILEHIEKGFPKDSLGWLSKEGL